MEKLLYCKKCKKKVGKMKIDNMPKEIKSIELGVLCKKCFKK